jgi:hypothetical protein
MFLQRTKLLQRDGIQQENVTVLNVPQSASSLMSATSKLVQRQRNTLVFGSYPVRISAGLLAILTSLLSFPQSLLMNDGLVPQNGPRPPRSKALGN